MTTLTQLANTWQALMTDQADELARSTGFVVKPQKITGASFAQSLMWGWLHDPESSLAGLADTFTHSQQQAISRQAIHARFSARAAHFMERLVGEAVKQVLSVGLTSQSHEWFASFKTVQVYDSTVIRLPDALSALYPGTQGSSMKIMVGMDLKYGSLEQVSIHAGRIHDQQALADTLQLPANSLFIADLGFFKLERFRQIQHGGSFWLSRFKVGTHLFMPNGQAFDLIAYLRQHDQADCAVLVGKQEHLPARLLALRVSESVHQKRLAELADWERRHQTKASDERRMLCQWAIYLTNLPPERLSLDQVIVVYSLRWQIELLFKLWKSHLGLAQWRTTHPWRILCELYAKLLAVLFVHGMMLLVGGHDLLVSSVQLCHTLQRHAWMLARYFYHPIRFLEELEHVLFCLGNKPLISSSCSSPPTHQKMRTHF